MLFLRDAMGNLVPLSRNAVGGFREPSFIGIGRMHDMSIGLRYLKSSDEINASSISSCKLGLTFKFKTTFLIFCLIKFLNL